jgi:hypothetical protein
MFVPAVNSQRSLAEEASRVQARIASRHGEFGILPHLRFVKGEHDVFFRHACFQQIRSDAVFRPIFFDPEFAINPRLRRPQFQRDLRLADVKRVGSDRQWGGQIEDDLAIDHAPR